MCQMHYWHYLCKRQIKVVGFDWPRLCTSILAASPVLSDKKRSSGNPQRTGITIITRERRLPWAVFELIITRIIPGLYVTIVIFGVLLLPLLKGNKRHVIGR